MPEINMQYHTKIYYSDEFLSGDSDDGEEEILYQSASCTCPAPVSKQVSEGQSLYLLYRASIAAIAGPNPVEDVMSFNPDDMMYMLGMHIIDVA